VERDAECWPNSPDCSWITGNPSIIWQGKGCRQLGRKRRHGVPHSSGAWVRLLFVPGKHLALAPVKTEFVQHICIRPRNFVGREGGVIPGFDGRRALHVISHVLKTY